MISKELFIEVINDLTRAEEYQFGLNSFFKNNDVDGYIFQPDCSVSVIKLLHEMFGSADEDDWIEYYCIELDYGKKYKPGCVLDKNKKEIKMSTPEELYDFLISNM